MSNTVELRVTRSECGRVTEVNGIPASAIMCGWFAMCRNDATHFEPHPVLTYVPACDRCPTIGSS